VYNFEHELARVSELLDQFPIVAMDTEFPGFLECDFDNGPEEQRQYSMVKASIDKMRIIQLGISLFDEEGRQPSPVSTWQFNLEWDLEAERHFPKSIQMLKEHGIDFAKLKAHGIPQQYFAEKATSSGLVLNDRLTWICFHGNQDFGFLVKLLTNENLPPSRAQFEDRLRHYFPGVVDIKSFMENYGLIGGLEKISKQLDVVRGGTQHQAGSDSLVTGQVFFAIFDNVATEGRAKERQSVLEAYNLDIYGYSNDQAYGYPS